MQIVFRENHFQWIQWIQVESFLFESLVWVFSLIFLFKLSFEFLVQTVFVERHFMAIMWPEKGEMLFTSWGRKDAESTLSSVPLAWPSSTIKDRRWTIGNEGEALAVLLWTSVKDRQSSAHYRARCQVHCQTHCPNIERFHHLLGMLIAPFILFISFTLFTIGKRSSTVSALLYIDR